MISWGVPFMNTLTGSFSMISLICSLSCDTMAHAIPLVLIRSSWIDPSASGSASAS